MDRAMEAFHPSVRLRVVRPAPDVIELELPHPCLEILGRELAPDPSYPTP